MDRGVLHKSSALVGEMGEGHGWWSVNNLRPPFHEQHNPSLFLPSSITTTSSTTPSSPLHSFSSLLLSNHYPLPTPASTTAAPWHDSSSSSRLGQQLPDAWSHILHGGLANNGEEGYKNNWEAGQVLFPSTPAAAEAADGGSGYNIYSNTASHGSSSTSDDAQFVARSSPWGGIHQHHHHHNALQQQASAAVAASSPRSSCITSSTSLGSNMLEFSNNSSPREGISTASGVAFKKARTQQEPSPAQSTVKVRKEKLGDRITALHQLVSPFGKTDTASVLLEAIGYIRFLHGQIEVQLFSLPLSFLHAYAGMRAHPYQLQLQLLGLAALMHSTSITHKCIVSWLLYIYMLS
ncbi:hypothetical protein GUJ93_ZPchr0006g42648 [Zizania palustris]|uniref:BHLH domain-containing protein n=1 Tax=Zizania palustris TaxID=103762 RepID=A0A8J5T6R4_ZIZPA|nr:hypothetical protein GUJ93_ZPchr0006g42648 [Zizania palustris]